MHLTHLLNANAKKRPEHTALTMKMGFRVVSLSYQELADLARKTAGLLAQEGVGRRDTVLLCAPNSPYWVAAFWGVLLRGAIAVPLNTQMTDATIQKISDETRPKIFLSRLNTSRDIRGDFQTYPIELLPEDTKNIPPAVETDVREDDDAEIIYTSGTTGDPKGVVLSHANLSANLKALEPLVKVKRDDRFLSVLPLSHVFEQTVGFLLPFSRGAQIVYAHSPAAIQELLREYHITKMVVVPEFLSVIYSRIQERAAAWLLSLGRILKLAPLQRLFLFPLHKRLGGKLRVIACGGAPLNTEIEQKWNALGIRILQGYGLTETSPIVAANTLTERKIGSVGKPVENIELRLAKDGEVLVRGPSIFERYFKNPEASKTAFTDDGWFKTGDIGEMDDDDFLFLRGRKKYLIKGSGAQNIYPEDIETVLEELGAASTVVGIPGEGGAVLIHAVLLGDIDDPSRLIADANERLASYQRITGWSLWPNDDFPRTPTRKVKRDEVINWIKEHKRSAAPIEKTSSPLTRLVANVTGIDESAVKPETKLVSELNLDSLLRVELVSRIETTFGAVINESDIGFETTVNDLNILIEKAPKTKKTAELKTWPFSHAVVFMRGVLLFFFLSFARLFVSLRVENKSRLEYLALPALFMPTHASYLDSVVLLMALPAHIRRKIAFAAAEDVVYKKYKIWSQLAELFFAAFPFPRKKDANVKAGLERIGRMLDRRWSVVVYPEGAMSETGEIQPLKSGTGLTAVEMGVPVVPVRISGSSDVVPYAQFLPRKRGAVTITFGEPLTFSKRDSHTNATETIAKCLHLLQK